MSDVTLSSAVRSNLLSLQNTADLMAKTQERLATGNKVNSALDNPTNFFTASSLNSRAGDLGRLLDSVANATQTLEAADNGISAITKLVESAQASARQAQQVKGPETTSVVTGDSAAIFNPQSLTSVAGDNGLVNLAADSRAAISTTAIDDDDANIANIVTADLDTNAADGLGLLSDTGADGPDLTDGDSITLTVDGTDYTLSFDADTADGAARSGNSTDGFNVTIGVDQQVVNLATSLTTLLAGSGVSVTGTDALTIASDATVDLIEFSDNTTNGGTLTNLGLDQAAVDGNAGVTATLATSSAADTGDFVVGRSNELAAVYAASGEQTLEVQLDGSSASTITIGAGNVTTKAGLTSAIAGAAGVDASANAANGSIDISTSDVNDASNDITFTASNATLNAALGFDVAGDDGGVNVNTALGLITTAGATNLVNQANGIAQGESLTIKIGNSPQLDITFGNGTNQVSTFGGLNERLQNLSGGAASVDSDGELNITADRGGDSVTIGGDDNVREVLGVRDADVTNLNSGVANSLLDGTNIAAGDKLNIQVGTNTELTVTFGTGDSQVSSLEELEDALGNLAGGTASIDDDTGAITIEATQGTDSITLSSTDAADVDKATVASSFGLSAGTTTSTTTNSDRRGELRAQFNELLGQVDELAEDAGFNGVNLLNGDDLKVIFNEDGSSKLDIEGVRFDSSSLGMSRASTNFFQDDANIEDTLATLDSVINTLRSQASKFGSNLSVVETRQDFTKATINTLETGAANLTLADTNEEGANLLALQTRQQLSSTALSLASQADQNVLRLF